MMEGIATTPSGEDTPGEDTPGEDTPSTESRRARQAWLQDLREKGTTIGIAGLYASGVALTLSQQLLGSHPILALGIPIGTLLAAGATALLTRPAPHLARALLVAAGLAVVALLVHPGGIAVAAPLLAVPILLAGITLNLTTAIALAVATSILLLIVPAHVFPLERTARAMALVAIASSAGLLWLVLHQLLWSVRWAWTSYDANRASLERARDLQVKLYETMEDLAGANAQLTRLNQLANNLRQIAEQERQAKQQFVANVSHELRTPLNMIIGFCEMMTKSPQTYAGAATGGQGSRIPSKLLADLAVVLRNSQHLSALIDDVLDLSQVDAGMMALTKERADLGEIVAAAVEAIQPLFASKNLTLDVEIAPNLPPLLCDRTRIREVVLNLLSNAGRYTEEGGCCVRVERDGPDLTITVTDTGPGIAPEDQDRVFRPFEQVDGSLRRRYGGTGLGLAISKRFVELHGGRMTMESAPGEGTTFKVRLPIEAPAASQGTALQWIEPQAAHGATPYEPRGRPRRHHATQVPGRMVVVEEGRALTRLVKRYMGDLEVVRVGSLEEARAEVERDPAEAILINDLRVGARLEASRDSELPPYVPVLICGVPAVEEALGVPGVSGYLVKPVSRAQLVAALDRLGRPIERVLIIDDERDALQLFRRMLASTDRGYRVLRATSARRGLELLASERPDAVLLDLVMPEMDGFGFLEAKAADPSFRDIPVILVSARDPMGHPIVSNALAVTTQAGLSIRPLLEAVGALTRILSPTARLGPTPPGAGPE
ncbi:MAG: ATP-binding protein [Anaerolineae bacterium]